MPLDETILLYALESIDKRLSLLESDWEGRGSTPDTGELIRELHTAIPHSYRGVLSGVADRPCTICGERDTHPIHKAPRAETPVQRENH